MENYIVSARKYRPSSFKTVVGQKALTHTLKMAIDSGRLAHAYLFCGPRGVGKTSCARIFAKTINCSNLTADGEACDQCESCVAFNEQRSFNIVELDAASNNSVDEMRNLTDQVRIPPQIGKYRVYIIDEVHMLSSSAFNAFLKTLEEPPAHAIFILATTEKHKILPTILSRCQIYDFSRITPQDIVEQLQYIASKEGISVEVEALDVIAQKSDGAMRDALSIFDQVAASSMGNITYKSTIANLNVLDYDYYFRLVDMFLEGNVPESLLIYKNVRDHGFDSLFFVNGLAGHLRNLMVARVPATISLLEVSENIAQQFITQGAKCSPAFLYKAMDLCNDCDLNYRNASNKQFLVELTLIKLCQLLQTPPTVPQKDTLHKVETNSVATAQPTATAAPQPQATPQATAQAAPAPAPTPSLTQTPIAGYNAQSPVRPTSPSINPHNRAAATPGTQRISINLGAKSAQATEQKAQNNTATSNQLNHFNEDQLHSVWREYIVNHPKEVLLVNAMKGAIPTILPDGVTIQLEVDNISQLNEVKDSKLVPFLRDKLGNYNISLNTIVNENAERTKIISPRDLLVTMMDRTPAVKYLIDTFRLGLA